ncbi:hypothetical protein EPUS_06286 [Endocarpon pusillum Z07020]|uniref:Uncharacterized protein n=1 Tax=Endocarpon pusillum (strain Z07020 / HMAS-L-300199) TaxID=1263415 RepID=U1GX32_ENDPU|nr:uncharacterized protein EPUS_06286 [Endocarpon pusillum Z07020]ERF77068.1 hypothetical protein EPUS_06286 [Endocarpon pusillum Z07020]
MSQPFQPPAVSTSQPSSAPKDRDAIFSKIYNYPWAQDSDFQTGFSSIAGDTGRNASDNPVYHETDLLLQAQCFYYARKYNLPDPVDVAAYKSWLSTEARSQPTVEQTRPNLHEPLSNQDTAAEGTLPQIDGTSSPNSNSKSDLDPSTRPTTSSTSSSNPSQQTSTATSTDETTQPAAPYPTNFSSIVDLITRGQPIPGIENIPDTVLDPSLSQPDSTPQRRKPWEKGDEEKEKGEEEEKKDGEGAGPEKETQTLCNGKTKRCTVR